MKWLYAWRAYFYSAASIAFIIILLFSAASFQKCEHERKDHEAYKALHYKSSLFIKPVVRLKLYVVCARATANENDGAITALSGIAVAIFTLALWVTTSKLWKAGEKQIALGQRQADIAERAILISNRPWIIVEVFAANDFRYGPNGAELTFEYNFRNVGNSPALRVWVNPMLYSGTRGLAVGEEMLRQHLKDEGSNPSKHNMGIAIAPGDTVRQTVLQTIGYDSIRETAESYKVSGKVSGLLPISLIGVVTYWTNMSTTEWHETSFYFEVMKRTKAAPTIPVTFSTLDVFIERNHIALEKSPFLSPYMT